MKEIKKSHVQDSVGWTTDSELKADLPIILHILPSNSTFTPQFLKRKNVSEPKKAQYKNQNQTKSNNEN